MHLSAFDRLLWATGFLGESILLCVLLIRRRVASFPIFTAWIALSIGRTIVMFLVYRYGSPRPYYYSFWILAFLDMALQLGLVYEIAQHVFAPLGGWAADVRRSFLGLIGGSVLFAILLMELASPAKRSPFEMVVLRGTFFSSVLMTELFVGLVALSATAGLPWRTHVARIAQGIGVFSFLGVLIDTASSWFRSAEQVSAIHNLAQVRIVAYLASLSYWTVTLWQQAPERSRMSGMMRLQIFNLHRQVEYDLGRIRGWRKI